MRDFFNKLFGKNSIIKSEEDIKESKHFCMVPWVHTHVLPDCRVLPCCVSDFNQTYGDVKKNTLKDVWNNGKYKAMRRLMIADRPVHSCQKCYELEESGITTMRKRMNDSFKHATHLLERTKNDGFLKDPEMKYLDIRFSNICNFKCRGCSPALSTKWYEDHQKLWNFKSDKPKLINASIDSPTLWSEIEEFLPTVEVAYFAGGEPLLMDEHYKCLEYLIENNKTDVYLQYNTNLSILQFKKYDLVSMWKKFKKIYLSISLDDIENKGEYFRSGLKWETFLQNVKTVKETLPHILVQVNCTITLFNIHRIPEIHKCLFDNKLIDEFGFNFNTLQDPLEYRTQVLTENLKDQAERKLRQYIDYLKENHPKRNWDGFIGDVEHQIQFMRSSSMEYKKTDFKEMTEKLDKVRNEKFEETYPELAEMMK